MQALYIPMVSTRLRTGQGDTLLRPLPHREASPKHPHTTPSTHSKQAKTPSTTHTDPILFVATRLYVRTRENVSPAVRHNNDGADRTLTICTRCTAANQCHSPDECPTAWLGSPSHLSALHEAVRAQANNSSSYSSALSSPLVGESATCSKT